jgi:hypothetical protein
LCPLVPVYSVHSEKALVNYRSLLCKQELSELCALHGYNLAFYIDLLKRETENIFFYGLDDDIKGIDLWKFGYYFSTNLIFKGFITTRTPVETIRVRNYRALDQIVSPLTSQLDPYHLRKLMTV